MDENEEIDIEEFLYYMHEQIELKISFYREYKLNIKKFIFYYLVISVIITALFLSLFLYYIL